MFLIELVSYQLIYKLVVVVRVLVLVLSVASLFGRYLHLELTTHFRMQYSLAALFCIVLLVGFHSWKLLPIAVCCAVFNFAYLVPYLFPKAQHERRSPSVHLRLMQVNLLKTNRDYDALIASVTEAKPDVVVSQELTEDWWNHTRVLGNRYVYVEPAPRPEGSGMALFSRYPLEDTQILTLDASDHLAMLARLNVEGTPVSILAMHPPTPVTAVRFANRNQQFREASALVGAIKGARVLIGDLNTTMWSPYFTDLTSRSGLRDARLGFGLRTTWPMPLPWLLRLPIDHCLVSADVVVEGVRLGKRTGSDHRPLVVDLEVER